MTPVRRLQAEAELDSLPNVVSDCSAPDVASVGPGEAYEIAVPGMPTSMSEKELSEMLGSFEEMESSRTQQPALTIKGGSPLSPKSTKRKGETVFHLIVILSELRPSDPFLCSRA